MSFFEIALVVFVVFVGLVLLYRIRRKHRLFGHSIGFAFSVFARIPVRLEGAMKNAAGYFHDACLASLRYPPGVSDGDYWSGINVLSRLVYFILAVCILVGETINTLLVLPSLFHTALHITLPGFVELSSAALFICCPALAGATIGELCGLIPHGAGLFPHVSTLKRWVLGILTASVLVLAILVTGYFYLYRAVYILDVQSTQGMSLYILGGLGLETAAMSVLALWALVVGGAGVVSLVLLLAEHVCKVIGTCVSFIPAPINDITVHVGGMSTYQEFEKPDTPQVPSVRFVHESPAFTLPQHPSTSVDAEEDTEEIVPHTSTIKEVSMRNSDPGKNASIWFGASYGTQMFHPTKLKIATLRATDSFLSSAYLDVSVTHVPTAIPGIADLSPSYIEKKAALLTCETVGQATSVLLTSLADSFCETHLPTRPSPAPLIFHIASEHLVDFVEAAETIKRRLPLHSLLVATSVSAQDLKNKVVQTGFADMQALVAEDIVEVVLVSDPHSRFASLYGVETQHLFLAHTLVSLVQAHKHSPLNRPFTQVLRDLHHLSPFIAVSFASLPVSIGDLPKKYSWLPGVKGSGKGDYTDILSQVRQAITNVITSEDTCTFPASVQPDAPCIVLSSVPVALSDIRYAPAVRDIALWAGSQYPQTTSITVRGNGIAYPHHIGSRYLVTAACLYPLAPASFPRLHESKPVKVTQLFPLATPEPANSNGNAPVKNEKANEQKHTKAIVPTRQKKAPAVRRNNRKHKEA